ncbi:formylglycine-generating enzyme family protein [Nocardioides lijunqiniae]|uniref:formylglycine-generating enzyme family protein n=1 Tax=Nocardioides lijunqiniae TaxID=2760832 RepID=UPI0030B83382
MARPDALAYASWASLRLPTEAEWEHAARGGVPGRAYAWGDELEAGGRVLANTYRGDFPWRSLHPRGPGTSAVGSDPPNGYGLVDMIGNVWERTSTPWTETLAELPPAPVASCCARTVADTEEERAVTTGGSHLCSSSYCRRSRPAARQGQGVLSSTSHVGLRCVVDA